MESHRREATELGVARDRSTAFDRVVGERTGEHKIEALAAARKDGRRNSADAASSRPSRRLPAGTNSWRTFGSYDRVYIPWELADVKPVARNVETDAPQISSALFVIGPEGGFSSDEVERAVAAGAIAVSLDTRILEPNRNGRARRACRRSPTRAEKSERNAR